VEGQFRLALSSSGENTHYFIHTDKRLRYDTSYYDNEYTQVFISNTVSKMLKTFILV
jgi:hypothetical protein